MTENELVAKWHSDAQQALRAEVRQVLEMESLPQTRASKEVGVAHGTWSAWLGDTYNGRTHDIAEKTSAWLAARREKASLAKVLPPAPGFQTTPTASSILSLLQFCQFAPDFGVVAMGPGVGKTTTIEAYRHSAPNVHVVTAEPVTAAPHAVMSELAEVIGVVEKSPTRLSRAIQQRLRGSGALIVVDEAQHLPTTTLDQLRSLHDKAGVGLVLAGNEAVYSRIAGDGGKAQFAQLYSRVGMKLTRSRPHDDDVSVMATGLGVTGVGELAILRAIARKPGALRGVVKTVRLARVLAAGDGEELAAKHLKASWSQIGAQALDL